MWFNFPITSLFQYILITKYRGVLLSTLFGLYFIFSKDKKEKKGLKKDTEQNLGDIYDLIYESGDEEIEEDPILLQKNLIVGIKKIAEKENIEIGIAAKDGLGIVTSTDKVNESFLGITTGLYDYIKARVFKGLKKVTVTYEEHKKQKTVHIQPIIAHGDIDYLIVVSEGTIIKNEKVIIENILDHLRNYKFIDDTGDDSGA